jgi:tRNA U34 5-carboxymethylaminomethyl modifying GTPase MnmE/TrmE
MQKISIKIVTNTSRKTIITDDTNTVRDVLEANDVNYETTPVYIDGAPLGIGDHDQTFEELGITEKCMLTAVIKTENA